MPSEPAWSKQIPNSSVCTWFYALALINLFFGVAGVLEGLYAMSKGKRTIGGLSLTFIFVTVGFINAWAFFVMCNRALHSEGFKDNKKHGGH